MFTISILFFTFLFHIIKLFYYKYGSIQSRRMIHTTVSSIISAIHSVLTCLYVSYVYYNNSIDDDNIYIVSVNPVLTEPIKFTMSYLIYDLFWSIYYKNVTYEIVLHHLVTTVSSLVGVITPYGRYVIFLSILNEASTPFLNLNTLIPKQYTLLRKLNLIMFAFTFFVFRTGLLSYIIFRVIQNIRFENMIVISMFIMYSMHYLLNFYWLLLILRKVKRIVMNIFS